MSAFAKSARSKDLASDQGEATIERLERELAEERARCAALRVSIEDLRFKLEVVEKSYLKQLSDTRVQRDAAQQRVADQEARLGTLDTAMAETLRLLTTTHEQLERVAVDHDRLRTELARREGIVVSAPAGTYAAIGNAEHAVSIDDLLAGPTAPRGRVDAAGHLSARVAAASEPPAGEMIAADLVFPKGEDGEDDDR
jgi:hypothetical protein